MSSLKVWDTFQRCQDNIVECEFRGKKLHFQGTLTKLEDFMKIPQSNQYTSYARDIMKTPDCSPGAVVSLLWVCACAHLCVQLSDGLNAEHPNFPSRVNGVYKKVVCACVQIPPPMRPVALKSWVQICVWHCHAVDRVYLMTSVLAISCYPNHEDKLNGCFSRFTFCFSELTNNVKTHKENTLKRQI